MTHATGGTIRPCTMRVGQPLPNRYPGDWSLRSMKVSPCTVGAISPWNRPTPTASATPVELRRLSEWKSSSCGERNVAIAQLLAGDPVRPDALQTVVFELLPQCRRAQESLATLPPRRIAAQHSFRCWLGTSNCTPKRGRPWPALSSRGRSAQVRHAREAVGRRRSA